LWADEAPTCPVEVRDGEVWVKTTLGHADPAAHWQQRLADGLTIGTHWVMNPAPEHIESTSGELASLGGGRRKRRLFDQQQAATGLT
jgi:hypothetical protein